jgi:GTP-binding protein YchF
MLKVGIVGLPNVGKSCLFNALTAAGAAADNYPFCTVDPNVGTVEVPEARLDRLHALVRSPQRVPTFIQFVDVAGLVEGASHGEGLGNQFLGHIRDVDAIAHVLRCFEDPDVAHVLGTVDPVRDRGIVDTELALADLEAVERRLEKVSKRARSGEGEALAEEQALLPCRETLDQGLPVRSLDLPPDRWQRVRSYNLLTAKPVLFVANVGESDLPDCENEFTRRLADALERESAGPMIAVSSRIEAELAELAPDERKEFLDELGVSEAGLSRLIRAAYGLLGLITFFTFNEKEARAWILPRGSLAPEAAGAIHTDFQRGFIRAETIQFEEFVVAGSMKSARELGRVRSEGKDYVVQDGDILLFRFSV